MHQFVSHFNGRTTAVGIDITWHVGTLGQGLNGARVDGVIRAAMAKLEEFQAGPLRCDENREALAHLTAALACLDARTRERNLRGVLGTESI